jgi:glyceraldehyde 3-phosphate dehydrogenase
MTQIKNIAINGAGRIGRAFLKLAIENENLNIVAINDLADIENIAYLMKYDSAYGRSNLDIKVDKASSTFVINGKTIKYLSEKDPALLPWKDLAVDIVMESTGFFTSYEKAYAHINAGAGRVVLSAPAKDESTDEFKGATVLMGINEEVLNDKTIRVTSNASCTTNASSPVIDILNKTIGIEKALLNTTHAYTASQALVDSPSKKDWREGRSAPNNMVPSSTGAAIAVTKVITDLEGKFDGISVRVPVITGSIVDITFIAKKNTTKEEINMLLEEAAKDVKWSGIFSTTKEELVSHDIVGNPHASIADLSMTRVVGGNLVKVLAWYDNEGGYTHSLLKHVVKVASI